MGKYLKFLNESKNEYEKYENIFFQAIKKNPSLLRKIAKDQRITKDINWSSQDQAAYEVWDLVFRGFLKDLDYKEIRYMFKSYGILKNLKELDESITPDKVGLTLGISAGPWPISSPK